MLTKWGVQFPPNRVFNLNGIFSWSKAHLSFLPEREMRFPWVMPSFL